MVIDVGAQNQCLGSHILNFQLKCRWVLLAIVVFVSFCTNEEGYPLETSTDDKCFFSSAIAEGFARYHLPIDPFSKKQVRAAYMCGLRVLKNV